MVLIHSNFFIPASKFISPFRSSKQLGRCFATQFPAPLCTPEVEKSHEEQKTERRSGNYQQSLWDFAHLQSLNNPFAGDLYVKHTDQLKKTVKTKLKADHKDAVKLLELIDDLQRLGLSYHFENQIKEALIAIHQKCNTIFQVKEDDLHAKSLMFRLFRQHGLDVSQDLFDSFKDEKGNFKTTLSGDTKGMLSLYEASYFLVEGENTLELARAFTTQHLKQSLDNPKIDQNLATLVNHSLELPLHWRTTRLEARWFIDVYQKKHGNNNLLLKLAKLDFNILQAKYQEDLKYLSRWWKDTGVVEKLTYTRDCVVPCFWWAVGVTDKPEYGYARRMSTKVNALITMLDDTYDVYGTVDELEIFTNAVERWDVNEMEKLPDYMKVCFLVLHNSINEMAYDALKEYGINTIPYAKKLWGDLCKAYLQEAKWYANGYKPTLEEYINNAWLSISAPVILVHTYMVAANPIKIEVLQALYNYPDIIRWSAIILRLADDLGTSSDEMERGDIPKSIQCYMIETGASEEQAREYVRTLIHQTWKKMNKDGVGNSPFSNNFIEMAMNLGRMAQCVYEFGDGHGNVNPITQDRISSLFFEPIPIEDVKY